MNAITNLTDRYVDAAMRTVPDKQRTDLAAELRASIEDQVDARVTEGEERDAAEREVLTALGDPERLAARYTDRSLHLIGPRYFLSWWRLLKLLLWIVLPCVAFAFALTQTLAGEQFGRIVGSTSVVLLMVTVHLTFWTTLVFAIIERSVGRDEPLEPWTPDQMPDTREKGAGFGELVSTLVFLGIMVGVVLWDRFIGFVPSRRGLSFLDDGLWPWWTGALFTVLALEAALAVLVYTAGRWTIRLAVLNGILNLAVAGAALWLLSADRLVNRDFFPTLIPDDGATVGDILAVIVGFAIAGVAIWSTIDAVLKARRT